MAGTMNKTTTNNERTTTTTNGGWTDDGWGMDDKMPVPVKAGDCDDCQGQDPPLPTFAILDLMYIVKLYVV